MEGSSRSGSAGRRYLIIQEGAQNQTAWFAAIAVFAFVRILLLLAAASGVRQLTTQGRAPLSVMPLSTRSLSREITLY